MQQQTTQDRLRSINTPREGYAPLHIRRRWFDSDGEGEEETIETPPPDTTPANSGQQGGESTGLTQAQFDAMIDDRLKRDRDAQRKKWLADLGYESEDALKADVEAKRAADEANQTDLDKAQTELETLRKKVEQAEAEAAQARQAALEERRNTAILGALSDAEKPTSVLTLLIAEHSEEVTAVLTDDGSINAKAVTALAEKARKDYAGMFAPGNPGSPSNAGGKVRMPDNKALREEILRKQRY